MTEPSAKKAGVTFDDCMTISDGQEGKSAPVPASAPVAPVTPITPAVNPPQIIIPPPAVTINLPAPASSPAPIEPLPVVSAPVRKVVRKKVQNCLVAPAQNGGSK